MCFGKNVLETERNKLTYDTELESLYLIGDFGVYSDGEYVEVTVATLILSLESVFGAIGYIGPTRMDYGKAVSSIEYIFFLYL